jgi:hypothetical protein
VIIPVTLAFASAVVARALPPPFSSHLADGITTAAVALIAYTVLSVILNRDDLVATARRVRSIR